VDALSAIVFIENGGTLRQAIARGLVQSPADRARLIKLAQECRDIRAKGGVVDPGFADERETWRALREASRKGNRPDDGRSRP
jgi:hypothetical protein